MGALWREDGHTIIPPGGDVGGFTTDLHIPLLDTFAPMPRTPLINILRRAIRTHLRDTPHAGRRAFLRTTALAGASVTLAPLLPSCSKPLDSLSSFLPRVVIIGAGLAGLNAAETLRKQGILASIYEASNRVGGRILSRHNLLFPGTVTELGAELIDSDDAELHRLAKELHLDVIDLHELNQMGLHESLFFGGRHYSENDVVREIAPILDHIATEAQNAIDSPSTPAKAPFQHFDAMSIQQYFDHLGLDGWLRQFLATAFITENGLELDEQSAMNFTSTIGLDVSSGHFSIYGSSDERYKIRNGNSQIPELLAQRQTDRIHTGHVLEAVKRVGSTYAVTLRSGQRVFDVRADVLILAIPFTMLRNVHLDVDLPANVANMIANLRYGANAKLVVAYEQAFWQHTGCNGVLYTDLPVQLTWDNTALQDAQGGGLTFFSGGDTCRKLSSMTTDACASYLMTQLALAWPAAASIKAGPVVRLDWPSMPWIKASYSSFGPGQWTQFSGLLNRGYHNNTLQFAGEHCSDEDRGFMNGAATSGRQAAERILTMLAVNHS